MLSHICSGAVLLEADLLCRRSDRGVVLLTLLGTRLKDVLLQDNQKRSTIYETLQSLKEVLFRK